MFVRRILAAANAGQSPDAWRSVSTQRMARLWVYVIYFPAHCVGVTNMCPHEDEF